MEPSKERKKEMEFPPTMNEVCTTEEVYRQMESMNQQQEWPAPFDVSRELFIEDDFEPITPGNKKKNNCNSRLILIIPHLFISLNTI